MFAYYIKLFVGIPYINTLSHSSLLYGFAYMWTHTYDNYNEKQHYDETTDA